MTGRSCRSRGICTGIVYVNTGEDEKAFLKRIRELKYHQLVSYIDFLNTLKSLQVQGIQAESKQAKGKIVQKTVQQQLLENVHQRW
jgi:hypothetical protein